ncbi:MAG TPA: hypothetical protein VK495_00585 [Steroidobacteraceae bacterium]|nr:hypothetical protein [Steroidobacteraceae bacterium]
MSKHIDSEQKLERALTQALEGLPLRRAPSTLELRVVDELERRAALPWWRVSFTHWPAAPRVAFVAVCIALVAATILGGVFAFAGDRSFDQAAALVLSWVQPFLAVMSSAGGVATLLVRVIPPLWLYGGLALGIMLYVALFGLGAAAYRTLYLRPSSAGDDL